MPFNTATPRTTATLWAIGLTTLPILALGSWIYLTVDRSLSEQLTNNATLRASSLSDRLSDFIDERLRDTQALAQQPSFTDRDLRNILTPQDKTRLLTQFVNASELYASSAIFDPSGQPIAQSAESKLEHPLDPDSVQQALSSRTAIVGSPQQMPGTDRWILPITASILDGDSPDSIGIVQTYLPLSSFAALLKNASPTGQQVYLTDRQGTVLFSSTPDHVFDPTRSLRAVFPALATPSHTQQTKTQLSQHQGRSVLLSSSPLSVPGNPNLSWSTITTIDAAIAFAPKQSLLNMIGLGLGVSAVGMGVLAVGWVRRRTAADSFVTTGRLDFSWAEVQQKQALLQQQLSGILNDMTTTLNATPSLAAVSSTPIDGSPTHPEAPRSPIAPLFATGAAAFSQVPETVHNPDDLAQALAQATVSQAETSQLIASLVPESSPGIEFTAVQMGSDPVQQALEAIRDLTEKPDDSNAAIDRSSAP